MVEILSKTKVNNFEAATRLALREAKKDELSPEVAKIFVPVVSTKIIDTEAEKSINATVRQYYGRQSSWYGQHWLVPIPHPRYDLRPVPQLLFTIAVHLVASIRVDTDIGSYRPTLVGQLEKSVRLTLPINFLQAVLDKALEQFELVGLDGQISSWNVPGIKEALRLPNDFVTRLSEALKMKSVALWLADFGPDGRALAPMVVGSLLGLQFHGFAKPVPELDQLLRREVVIKRLTQMYGSAVAAEMFAKNAPYLKSTMTNNEAISLILKNTDKWRK